MKINLKYQILDSIEVGREGCMKNWRLKLKSAVHRHGREQKTPGSGVGAMAGKRRIWYPGSCHLSEVSQVWSHAAT